MSQDTSPPSPGPSPKLAPKLAPNPKRVPKPKATWNHGVKIPPGGILYGYCRVSTKKQVVIGQSIPSQIARLQLYATENNLPPPVIYKDIAKSGSDDADREEFKTMSSLLKKGDSVICTSFSRIYRNQLKFLLFIDHLKSQIVPLHSVNEGITVDIYENPTSHKGMVDPNISFTLSMMSSFYQFELEKIRQRTSDTMQFMSDMGILRTKPNFGYTYDKNTHEKIEVPDQQRFINFVKHELKLNPTVPAAHIARKANQLIASGQLKYKNLKTVQGTTIIRIINYHELRPKGFKPLAYSLDNKLHKEIDALDDTTENENNNNLPVITPSTSSITTTSTSSSATTSPLLTISKPQNIPVSATGLQLGRLRQSVSIVPEPELIDDGVYPFDDEDDDEYALQEEEEYYDDS